MNPRLLITLTLMLLSQSVLLAVSPLVTDDADTVEPGKLQLNCDFQFVRTSSTLLYSGPDQSGLGLDSSSRARRNIRLSVARRFRVCHKSRGPNRYRRDNVYVLMRALASAELRAALAIHFCTATACIPAIALSRSANSALAVTHSRYFNMSFAGSLATKALSMSPSISATRSRM